MLDYPCPPYYESDGFLCDFKEVDSTKPKDGNSGWITVYYGGEHCNCCMRVNTDFGGRVGKAIIYKDEVPYIILENKYYFYSGTVERLNDYGMVELRGFLIHGKETGFFEEYDKNGRVIWRGYYRNGQRYIDVRGKFIKKGDDSEMSKPLDGFYELDDKGAVKNYCLYRNGMSCCMVMEFHGDIMTEYDKKDHRIYEGGYTGDTKSGFVRDGKGREFDLEQHITYSGEWKNGKREGLGTEYQGIYPLYSGEWRDGKRHGKGKEMDKSGNVVRSGRWYNGVYESRTKKVPTSSSTSLAPCRIEKISSCDIGFDMSGLTVLKLSSLPFLKRIEIGDGRFGDVRKVEFCKLSSLEEIVIGKRCFTSSLGIDVNKHYRVNKEGYFRIMNCPKLKSIQIGDFSFSDYISFKLGKLPSLQSIKLDRFCFYFVMSFSLISLCKHGVS